MKKLSLLIFLLAILTVSCVAQTNKWYNINYKPYFTDTSKFAKPFIYQGTLLTPSPAEINLLHGLAPTKTELGYVSGVTSAIQTQLNAKQATLVSGVNLATVAGQNLLLGGNVAIAGTGTVTSFSVTSANGVSASVATATSTPNATFSLGAITPTSVSGIVLSGNSTPTLSVTGTSSITGSNTGDNAVNSLYSGLVSNANHSGDATGSTVLTISNGAVTLAKMANMATSSLIYRRTAGTGVPEVTTLAQLKIDLGLTGTNSGDQTSVTGNAGTATKLQTAILLNGVSTDFSSNVNVPSNITPGTANNVMTSNGSVWYSKTPMDTTSVTNGIPMPQLTTTQINALSPVEGQTVYDITLHVMKFWNGSVWKTITTN
jgi:hypothetical protein